MKTNSFTERRREEIEAICEQWYDHGIGGKAVLITELAEYLYVECESAYLRGLRQSYLKRGFHRRLRGG